MPFFSPKTWKQRIVEFPGRRRLDDTSSADVYDVSRAEGTVTQEGDGFTAANMNDLEQRINNAVNDLEQRINNAVNDVAGLSADEYDPNATYSSGDLRIHDNILHKANQDISVAEAWTPEHWDPTTLAAELSAVNSRTFPDPASGTAIGEVDSYTAPSDGWLSLRLSGHNTNAQGIIECVDDNHIVGQSVYGPTGEWGILTAMLPVKKGKTYHYVITSGTFQGFYFFGNHEPAI